MYPATVAFPMNAVGAAHISMPVLCAATSAVAFRIQEGDVGGIREIYEHLGVAPEHYGEAVRQMSTAWSVSRWFAKPNDIALAIRPTESMVEEIVQELSTEDSVENGLPSQKISDEVSLADVDEAVEDDDPNEMAYCLKYVAVTSLYVGDIATAVAAMHRTWDFLPWNVRRLSAVDHMHLAACWAVLGDGERAVEHVNLVYTMFAGASPSKEETIHREAARAYAAMGAPKRAANAARSIRTPSHRFAAFMRVADDLRKLRGVNGAEAYFLNECFTIALEEGDFRARVYWMQKIVDAFVKRGMHDSARKVMEVMTDPSSNLDSLTAESEFAIDAMAWAAKTMKVLDYPLGRIIGFLTRGFLDEDHPSFTKDASGMELRRAQAEIVTHRWGDELEGIAREWANI